MVRIKIQFNKSVYISAVILVVAFFTAGLIFIQGAGAQEISYPVAELGNCGNRADCKSFCGKSENIISCVNFAEDHNLMSKEEASRAKKFAAIGTGPGGCTDQASCENYCNDANKINECLSFAESKGLMSKEQLKEAKQIQQALAKGAKLPGGCKNKNECDSFCQSPDHMEECIEFADAAGFIPPEELEDARKVLALVKQGVKPPPCRGKKECDAYCAEPGNFKSCLEFAEKAGFISQEEAEMARKTGGKGPGNCRGKEECDKFCEDENNFSSCVDFALEHDLMSKEDAEMARKTGGKGPGNCKGKEACEKFCQDPANQEACFSFAQEHGLIKEEDLEQMEEGKQKMQEAFSQASPEVMDCIESKLGSEAVDKLQAGTGMPSKAIGDVMKTCFETMMSQVGEEMMENAGQQGDFGPDDIPEGMGPDQAEMREMQEEMKEKIQGEMMPQEFDDMQGPPSPEMINQMKEKIQSQVQEQVQEQMQNQIQQQMQQQMLSGAPGGNMMTPPAGFGPQ